MTPIAVIALLPLVGALAGVSMHELGATPPPKNPLVLNASVVGHKIDSNGDAWMDLEYRIGTGDYLSHQWVPRSYYDQMANLPYSPITVPNPLSPYNIRVGPPRGQRGFPVWGLYVYDELIALGLLAIFGYFESRRIAEFNLLRHGYSAIGTVLEESAPSLVVESSNGKPLITAPGVARIQFMTPQGVVTTVVHLSPEASRSLLPGSQMPVLYRPDSPLQAKPLLCFESVEMV